MFSLLFFFINLIMMMLKIQLWITGISYIYSKQLIYIVIIFTQYNYFTVFLNKYKAALVNIRDVFQINK